MGVGIRSRVLAGETICVKGPTQKGWETRPVPDPRRTRMYWSLPLYGHRERDSFLSPTGTLGPSSMNPSTDG